LDSGYPISNSYDGDWSTYARASTTSNSTAELYVNYTIPSNASSDSIFMAAVGAISYGTPVNYTVPSDCWNVSGNNMLQFRLNDTDTYNPGDKYHATYSAVECRNSTGWNLINSGTSNYFHGIFEEAMWWISYVNVIQNTSAAVNGSNTFIFWTNGMAIGNYSLYGYVNDTSNNVNISSVTWLSISNPIPPYIISFTSNQSIALTGSTIVFNSSIQEGSDALDSWWFIRGWCYQETANVSSECGGVSSGTYSCSGTFDNPCSNAFDGNWGSVASYAGLTTANISVNYTIPDHALSTSIWQTKDFGIIVNNTIPSSCWNVSGLLIFKTLLDYNGGAGSTTWYCYNSTSWITFYSTSKNAYEYEESMWWYIDTVQNISSAVNGTNSLSWTSTQPIGNYSFIPYVNDSIARTNYTNPIWVYFTTSEINMSVWNGTAYTQSATAKWRCTPTQSNCSAVNQTDTYGIYDMMNNASTGLPLRMRTNVSAPSNMTLKCDDDNNADGAINITTSYQTIVANVAANSHQKIWCWMDYYYPSSGWMFAMNATYTV
jgi:hypothetical protein